MIQSIDFIPEGISIQEKDFLIRARVLFVINNCGRCANWKEFIDRLNMQLPRNKRIRVVNATNLNSIGVWDYSILKTFDRFMVGNYPFLFLGGKEYPGANSETECEAFLRAYLHKEFIINRENPDLFNKNCRYEKKGIFGRKVLICGEEND